MCCDFHVYIESIGVEKKCATTADMSHPFQLKQAAHYLSNVLPRIDDNIMT